MTVLLPEGFTTRSATAEDAERVSLLSNARHQVLCGDRPSTPERVRQQWEHPLFDLSTDSRLVFAPDGPLVGYAQIRDIKDPPVDVFGGVTVHPDMDDAEWLWDSLLRWMDVEARRVIPKAPKQARLALVSGASANDETRQRQLVRHAFECSRSFHRMQIDFAASDEGAHRPTPEWPEGIRVRNAVPGADDHELVTTHREAFAKHYGHLPQPFDKDLAEWRRWMDADDFDPSLWFLACRSEDGGIVGVCTCYEEAPGDTGYGLIDELGVRPAWRGRGIGRTLLLHAFAALAARGLPGAVLTVDTKNRTGATALYESVGMRPVRVHHTYVKQLRPGVNLVAE